MQQLTLDLAPPPPTLENFVPGANAQVLAALRAMLAGAAGEHRLCLWGGPGSGKSHLLAASVKAGGGLYLACGNGLNAAATLDIYELPGVLALDDVERLDEAGQIALFNLINRRMHNANSGGANPVNLIVSCSRPLSATGLRADLATRLAQGLVLEVAALSDGEKAAALTQHAKLRGIALADEVTRYLLSHVARDLPTLVALLDALDKLSLERQRPITVPLVREVLQNPVAADQPAN